MIDVDTVWREIWPVVEALIHAVIEENSEAARALVQPGEKAAQMLEMFGFPVLDIQLKTVLGRDRLAVTRAIETEHGRYVHMEYAWPDPELGETAVTPSDLVAVRLSRDPSQESDSSQWRVVEINPASIDLPMSGARARTILASVGIMNDPEPKVPSEPWLLPVALYAGYLGVQFKAEAFGDEVEKLLLPGLQARGYGFMSLLNGRCLWRDFVQAATPDLSQPAAWAAAAEFVMGEQEMREQTQAAVAKHYKANLAQVVPRIKQIKKSLQIQGVDDRYSDFLTTQIVYKEGENNEQENS